MAADDLDDFRDELRRLGDIVWRRAHRTPMLIVLGKTAELVDFRTAPGFYAQVKSLLA